MTHPERNELLELAEAYIEGTLDPPQMARLDRWLREDAEARRVFVAYTHDHAALYWRHVSPYQQNIEEVMEDSDDCPEVIDFSKKKRDLRSRWTISGLAAAAVLLLGISLWFLAARNADEIVAKGFNSPAGSTLEGGDLYKKGELVKREEGEAEFIFKETGVHVIATAPFEIELGGRDWLRVMQGNVKLTVPAQGVGFKVKTEDRIITDLGTQFVVSVGEEGTRVLVFQGEVDVASEDGEEAAIKLIQGETGLFKKGKPSQVIKRDDFSRGKQSLLPELSPMMAGPNQQSLRGRIFTLPKAAVNPTQAGKIPPLSYAFHELIRSGFKKETQVNSLQEGSPLIFGGIAGHYYGYPLRNGLPSYSTRNGWIAWYKGAVIAPEEGRYRFWGRADNQLLVAINGQQVFEGGIGSSSFGESLSGKRNVRRDYPFYATGGLVSGEWFTVSEEAVRLDLLFGETENQHTVGLLMIEKEGAHYEQSHWGQPQWPLFLTEWPSEPSRLEMRDLKRFLEENMQGSFSFNKNALWRLKQE